MPPPPLSTSGGAPRRRPAGPQGPPARGAPPAGAGPAARGADGPRAQGVPVAPGDEAVDRRRPGAGGREDVEGLARPVAVRDIEAAGQLGARRRAVARVAGGPGPGGRPLPPAVVLAVGR